MNHETKRRAEFKVGIFVIGALVILIAGALWISGSQYFRGNRNDYWVLMKSSGGIDVGDRVRMAGVTIGRVNEVRLRPSQAWPVAFQVGLRADVPIKTDSKARIVSSGLLGDGFLQIDPGNAKSPSLKQGGEILSQTTPDLQDILTKMGKISTEAVGGLDQVTAFMDQVSLEVVPLLKNMNTLVSEENASHVRRILSNLDETVDQAGTRFSSLSERLEPLSNHLDKTLGEASVMMKTFTGVGNDFRTAIGPEGSRITTVLDQAENTLISAKRSLSVIEDNREELTATMSDLQISASNLKAFSQQIKERPFSLIRMNPEPDRRPGQGLRKRKK